GAFAWHLSEEPFMSDVRLFSNLKTRISYGITGNQTFANYLSLQRLGNTISFLGNRRVPGIANVQMANPELKWEKTAQFDAGVDFSMLNGRLSFVIDYYSKRTRDLL